MVPCTGAAALEGLAAGEAVDAAGNAGESNLAVEAGAGRR